MHDWAPHRVAEARVARLGTTRPDGAPHLVPIVYALDGDVVWSAVDSKPKSTRALRRLANIAADPRVCLLVDHYADNWTALWWARLDGRAEVLPIDDPRAPGALALLAAKYEQYRGQPPAGPLIRIEVTRWTSWSAH